MPGRPFRRWYHDAKPGLPLVPYILLVCLLGYVRHVYDDEQHLHAADCVSSRLRTEAVETRWINAANAVAQHAQHERVASRTWATIVKDMDRDRIGDATLRADVWAVSATWTRLAVDDDASAELDRAYANEVSQAFNTTCGVAPTPEPMPTP